MAPIVRDVPVTLTTDFREGSAYVAALKGALLSVNPQARLVDLSHGIPPQDLLYASHLLSASLPFFPAGSIHVIVVDPGVGTDRALLLVEAGGHLLLAPDNGCWVRAAERLGGALRVRSLTEPRLRRHPVSATFHGRDIFAPAAGHLSLGVSPADFGPEVLDWVRLPSPAPVLAEDSLRGEIVFADPFGNLLTNIPGQEFARLAAERAHIRVGPHEVARVVRTYGEAEPNAVVALISSDDCLEIAVVNGSAARVLGVGVGTPVVVSRG